MFWSIKSLVFKVIVTTIFGLSLISCGGGGSSSNGDTISNTETIITMLKQKVLVILWGQKELLV